MSALGQINKFSLRVDYKGILLHVVTNLPVSRAQSCGLLISAEIHAAKGGPQDLPRELFLHGARSFPREIKGFDGLSCPHDVQSRILTIRMTVLDLVGVLGAVILHFWEASQEVARLLVELAEGLYNDLIGDRYIAT